MVMPDYKDPYLDKTIAQSPIIALNLNSKKLYPISHFPFPFTRIPAEVFLRQRGCEIENPELPP
jgi:hypothetical protein